MGNGQISSAPLFFLGSIVVALISIVNLASNPSSANERCRLGLTTVDAPPDFQKKFAPMLASRFAMDKHFHRGNSDDEMMQWSCIAVERKEHFEGILTWAQEYPARFSRIKPGTKLFVSQDDAYRLRFDRVQLFDTNGENTPTPANANINSLNRRIDSLHLIFDGWVSKEEFPMGHLGTFVTLIFIDKLYASEVYDRFGEEAFGAP